MKYEHFTEITKKYGYWSSWAIWAAALDTPKSNIGNLTIFEDKEIIDILKPNIVLVGLNISRGAIKEPLANFHDKRPEATDFKIRHALFETPIWGAYMTDIIKDFEEKVAGNLMSYLNKHKEFEKENIKKFEQELIDIGSKNPIIIALGNDSYKILKRNLKKYKIYKVSHYSAYITKEKLRLEFKNLEKEIIE